MAAHERVLMGGGDVFLLSEAFERLQHAAAGLLRGRQIFHARLVGRGLLRAALAQQRAHDHVVAAHGEPAAGAANLARRVAARERSADHQADTENGQQQALGGIAGDAAPERGKMPAHDVAGLVRRDGNHAEGGPVPRDGRRRGDEDRLARRVAAGRPAVHAGVGEGIGPRLRRRGVRQEDDQLAVPVVVQVPAPAPMPLIDEAPVAPSRARSWKLWVGVSAAVVVSAVALGVGFGLRDKSDSPSHTEGSLEPGALVW